jgi:hypothetical protein
MMIPNKVQDQNENNDNQDQNNKLIIKNFDNEKKFEEIKIYKTGNQ